MTRTLTALWLLAAACYALALASLDPERWDVFIGLVMWVLTTAGIVCWGWLVTRWWSGEVLRNRRWE